MSRRVEEKNRPETRFRIPAPWKRLGSRVQMWGEGHGAAEHVRPRSDSPDKISMFAAALEITAAFIVPHPRQPSNSLPPQFKNI